MEKTPKPVTRKRLELLYRRYNRREEVHPDPLEFLYSYTDPLDREVAALVGSCLAYGRVAGILKSVSRVLNILGDRPARYLQNVTSRTLQKELDGFVHRFADGKQMAGLLWGVKQVIERQGSLYELFRSGYSPSDNTLLPAMERFVETLVAHSGKDPGHLLARPVHGSACKRAYLMFRWMVRKDSVDPGGWKDIDPSKLIVPLDTHMHRFGWMAGFTERKSGNLKTAVEITDGFRLFSPNDPVRYDFAVTRLGFQGKLAGFFQ